MGGLSLKYGKTCAIAKSVTCQSLSVGWCLGNIVERNTNANFRKMLLSSDGSRKERCPDNFRIVYEIDQQTVSTVLRGGEDDMSCRVLLEP